jgi:cytochrome bd ubiquinol oxidase subunit II
MDTSVWLPVAWYIIIGFAVCMYVILDGFDLGVGILFPLFPDESDRDLMMNSVAPFWDGNETWLVLGGGGLLVAFPLAYAVIMPALYLPITIMLIALVFRGVAFEFRWVAKPHHHYWDVSFAGGSLVAAFAQGVVLGGLLQGIEMRDRAFAGGALDWFTPFSLFAGLAVVAGYALLGATWLILRVEGDIIVRLRQLAKNLLVAVVAGMAVVSLWTPLISDQVFNRWFSWPNIAFLAPLPVLTLVAAFLCFRAIQRETTAAPFILSIALFLLGYAGLAVSNVPYLVPQSLTIFQAAADPSSQLFMFVGTVALLPFILGYTAFVYWTFRGKVRPGEGYH